MGRVLLAHDPVLDRPVAIKHLRDDLNLPPEVRAGLLTRMRHEARAAARVMHPHLITLHDMGEDEALGLYLVFEYVEGATLKERLLSGRLSAKECARLVRELGSALSMAHGAGIVHRDIKPENIILSPAGAKIADFGIARIPNSTLTHAGGLMGTPAYSAPETFRESLFSPESDQFSLAATIYEAISGKRAFPGDDAISVAARIASGAPDPIAKRLGLRDSVDDALMRAMSREPGERFASCDAFGKALSRALSDERGASSRADKALGLAHKTPLPAMEHGEQGVDSARDSHRKNGELPRERNAKHVLLGAAVVTVTLVLLMRAALKDRDAGGPLDPNLGGPDGGILDAAGETSSAQAASKPVPAPPTRIPKAKSSSETEYDAGTPPLSDAGGESDASDSGNTADASAALPSPSAEPGPQAGSDAGASEPKPQAPDASAPPKSTASSSQAP